jgi:hypothetical protein
MPLVTPDVAVLATLTEFASGSAGTIVVITAVLAGWFRAWAVLSGFPTERIERVTASGFLAGIVIMLLLVVVDTTLRWR